jgi:hypothetical protein
VAAGPPVESGEPRPSRPSPRRSPCRRNPARAGGVTRAAGSGQLRCGRRTGLRTRREGPPCGQQHRKNRLAGLRGSMHLEQPQKSPGQSGGGSPVYCRSSHAQDEPCPDRPGPHRLSSWKAYMRYLSRAMLLLSRSGEAFLMTPIPYRSRTSRPDAAVVRDPEVRASRSIIGTGTSPGSPRESEPPWE